MRARDARGLFRCRAPPRSRRRSLSGGTRRSSATRTRASSVCRHHSSTRARRRCRRARGPHRLASARRRRRRRARTHSSTRYAREEMAHARAALGSPRGARSASTRAPEDAGARGGDEADALDRRRAVFEGVVHKTPPFLKVDMIEFKKAKAPSAPDRAAARLPVPQARRPVRRAIRTPSRRHFSPRRPPAYGGARRRLPFLVETLRSAVALGRGRPHADVLLQRAGPRRAAEAACPARLGVHRPHDAGRPQPRRPRAVN